MGILDAPPISRTELRTATRRTGALPALPIASGGGMAYNVNVSTSATGYSSRQVFKAAVDATDLRLTYPLGFYIGASAAGETAINGAVSFKASIEMSNGYIAPVFFRGQRTGTTDPWATVSSDPVALNLKAGDVFYVRTFLNATTGLHIMNTGSANGPGVSYSGQIGYATGDYADGGGTFTVDIGGGYWGPVVTGTYTGTSKAAVAIVGDSISVGYGTSNGSWAWWKRGLNNAFPAIQYARTGAYAQSLATLNVRGFPMLTGCTHGIVLAGSNDLTGSRTLANIQADLLAIWNQLAGRGIKVYAATIPPNTTSTDAWVTTTNQTPVASNATRILVNTWIRAGAPLDPTTKAPVAVGTSGALLLGATGHPLTGVIETADVCETARDSGIWKANYTADGVHPGDTAATAMGAVIPTAAFTV